ncbi:DUF481 domain-containing protein [Saccharobesus litoralis]|uniref:DUF481 domain-containing protein n=1 Tax=Saccharobesus litoralis TaxID=2172099 RepID=UPI00131F3E81|nr:DUF481 domain-containing protein [Saccharobesus litoralis]
MYLSKLLCCMSFIALVLNQTVAAKNAVAPKDTETKTDNTEYTSEKLQAYAACIKLYADSQEQESQEQTNSQKTILEECAKLADLPLASASKTTTKASTKASVVKAPSKAPKKTQTKPKPKNSAFQNKFTDLPWRASAELGVTDTSGNNTGSLIKFKTDFEWDGNLFRTSLDFDLLYKKDEKERDKRDDQGAIVVDLNGNNVKESYKQTTAHRYNIAVQSNYKGYTDKNQAVFGRMAYSENRFSSFDYQASISIGYNTRLLRSDDSFLDISVGPGIAFEAAIENKGKPEQQIISDDYFQLFSAAKYERKLSETAYFKQHLTIEGNAEDNTKTISETAITSKINGSLALKASIKFVHNSDVAEGFEKTDRTTGATLVYTF